LKHTQALFSSLRGESVKRVDQKHFPHKRISTTIQRRTILFTFELVDKIKE
jgi:hypothetical protein